jgi:hypothetical protein
MSYGIGQVLHAAMFTENAEHAICRPCKHLFMFASSVSWDTNKALDWQRHTYCHLQDSKENLYIIYKAGRNLPRPSLYSDQ